MSKAKIMKFYIDLESIYEDVLPNSLKEQYESLIITNVKMCEADRTVMVETALMPTEVEFENKRHKLDLNKITFNDRGEVGK